MADYETRIIAEYQVVLVRLLDRMVRQPDGSYVLPSVYEQEYLDASAQATKR